jgi:hypothetical protein
MLTEDLTIKDLDGTFQDAGIYYQVRLWSTHYYSSSLCGVCISLRFIFAKSYIHYSSAHVSYCFFIMLLRSDILVPPM